MILAVVEPRWLNLHRVRRVDSTSSYRSHGLGLCSTPSLARGTEAWTCNCHGRCHWAFGAAARDCESFRHLRTQNGRAGHVAGMYGRYTGFGEFDS
jgi:hypothetical protein